MYLLITSLYILDAHVGQHIFKQCIRGALRGKTRILVTHQVHLLDQCDMIVILDDGKVKASGSFTELQRSGLDISAYIAQNEADSPASAAVEEEEGNGVEEEVMSIAGKHTVFNCTYHVCVAIY